MQDERLNAGDGIAVAITGMQAACLMAFPWVVGQSFAQMYLEFGAAGGLPLLTRLALSIPFPMSLGATTAIGPVLGCISAVPLSSRRVALVAAFLFGCAAIAVCMVGVYQPMFDLAGKIKAD
jgi:hypothetical protein